MDLTFSPAAPRPTHILIVDDDRDIRSLLADYLQANGYATALAADGLSMWQALGEQPADLVVLDLNLPGDDGLSLCRQLRTQLPTLPIIMLTARSEPLDRIIGLEVGADDYLGKPFEPRELLARIRTVLRRVQASGNHGAARPETQGEVRRLRFAGWTLDLGVRHLLAPDGTVVMLSSGEFRLLKALAEHGQQVLSRDQLLNLTKGRDADPFDRSIDLQISRLRAKLREDARAPTLLKTLRNEGYVLAVPVSSETSNSISAI